MPNQSPMWWTRSGQQRPHAQTAPAAPPAPPKSPPEPLRLPPPPVHHPEPQASIPPRPAVPPALNALTDRLRHMDGETLLLLALLWLLWQEHADPKLLLALAYIAL